MTDYDVDCPIYDPDRMFWNCCLEENCERWDEENECCEIKASDKIDNQTSETMEEKR